MNNYKLLNNIFGWLAFAIATTVYLVTMEPTGSFWDCGEFISAALKLEVGHPPGAPMFMLMGRVATLFGSAEDPASYARMVNGLSGICSGFTILFLFWTITAMAKKLYTENNKEQLSQGNIFAILGAGLVGALCYTFSDTFWFSAVEGEVYATSSMFTALTVWLIMKWDERVAEGDARADRYLVLIAYVVGIAIGVHLLNLLCIPAIAYIYYFRKYKNTTRKGFIVAGIVGFLALMFVQYGIIPGFIVLASKFEKGFVNGLGMPFNSGLIFYLLFLTGLLVFGLMYTKRKGLVMWNTIILSLTVIMIGYSSYAVILIRSNAKTPMNENDPSNVFSMLSYINRDQYGQRPLFYGQYYNAPLDKKDRYKDGDPVYFKDVKNNKYSIADDAKNSVPNFDKAYCTVLPRMWSAEHASSYMNWIDMPPGAKNKKPSFGQNIGFMINYQMGWMWWRYFMWNFAGRQNDIQGLSGPLEGNWISGIGPLDNVRLGNQSDLPETLANNKGKNKYYLLPFLLGVLGLIFHFRKDKNTAWVVLLLLLFLGVLINVFLNPTPVQPRERDYAYVGSFYAYAIWVGFGVLALYDFFRRYSAHNIAAVGATALSLVAVPMVMANQNWDDHDRSKRYTSADFAKNYLDSCAPNAILFTNGDNDTFPLWYVQEVEGYRTDVRVVNLSLLNTDWYINQLKRKAYLSDAVPFTMTEDYYRQGTRDAVLILDNNREDDSTYVDINVALKQIMSKDLYKVPDGQGYNNFKHSHLYIPVDKQAVVANGTVPANLADRVAPVKWDLSDKGVLYKKDMMILDLLATNNWKRPVYFAITVGDESYLGLEPYFQLEGLAYRIVPVERQSMDGQIGAVNTEIMYKNLIEKFRWGNMSDPSVYLDETNLRMTMNFRNNFSRLAAALLTEGKRDQAKKVLDRCLEVMPDNTVPYNYFVLPIANLYFELGDKQKAKEILARLKKITGDELAYYNSLSPSLRKSINTTIGRTKEIMKRVTYLEKMFLQKESGLGGVDGPNAQIAKQDTQKAPVDTPKQIGGTPSAPAK